MSNRIVLMGGSGLVGSKIFEKLHDTHEIIVIDKKKNTRYQKQFNLDIFQNLKTIEKIIVDIKPDIVLNTINMATILSENGAVETKKAFVFFLTLKDILIQNKNIKVYAQVGTTGTGGLGLTIPFTHGQNIDSMPILMKSATAGIITMLLTLLQRTPGHNCKIIEIKPGICIFDDKVKVMNVSGLKSKTIDGGESGHYTYDELSILTSFMKYNDVSSVADVLIEEVLSKKTKSQIKIPHSNNIISAINTSIFSVENKPKINQILDSLKPEGLHLIATGNLGPPELIADLVIEHAKRQIPKDSKKVSLGFLIGKNTFISKNINYLKINKPDIYKELIKNRIILTRDNNRDIQSPDKVIINKLRNNYQ